MEFVLYSCADVWEKDLEDAHDDDPGKRQTVCVSNEKRNTVNKEKWRVLESRINSVSTDWETMYFFYTKPRYCRLRAVCVKINIDETVVKWVELCRIFKRGHEMDLPWQKFLATVHLHFSFGGINVKELYYVHERRAYRRILWWWRRV